MFSQLEMAPPDSIMGITEDFKKDTSPNKINLSMGIFKDIDGNTPVLDSVRQAEKQIFELEKTKSYSGIEGFAEITQAVPKLLFGENHEILADNRALALHTPGGTGALRIAAEFIAKTSSTAPTIWISEPTWANHINIFQAAGFQIKRYPYFDKESNGLDFAGFTEQLEKMPEGDCILFHGCCHNPTGVDPTHEQWGKIAGIVQNRKLFPIIDFAYQGFAQGLQEDSEGPMQLLANKYEALICGSFSKNFALYNERTGSLTVIGASTDATTKAMSQVKVAVRSVYSSPPAHGGKIVSTILADTNLRTLWESELTDMRNRIREMRTLFAKTLKDKGVDADLSFVTQQNGMFSFSGLKPDQVKKLRDEHSVYIVGNGRINVAAITTGNVDTLCSAVASVW